MTIDAEAVRRRIGLHQFPMFAHYIEIMEVPEKLTAIPSVVMERFDRANWYYGAVAVVLQRKIPGLLAEPS